MRSEEAQNGKPTLRTLIVDGHPSGGRLTGYLLDRYAAALPASESVDRLALRELAFDPLLRHGYGASEPTEQVWEPDLERAAARLDACDHLVVGFPLWWGGEPALVKGFIDRLLLPGFSHRYRHDTPFWDRRLAGRSADVLVTMDTPPWALRLLYGDPVGRRWRAQVLGFCGFAPVRVLRFGPTRRGGTARSLAAWEARAARAATTAPSLRRARKRNALADRVDFGEAVAERRS